MLWNISGEQYTPRGVFWDCDIDIFLDGIYFTASQSEAMLKNLCKWICNSTWNLLSNQGPRATLTLQEKVTYALISYQNTCTKQWRRHVFKCKHLTFRCKYKWFSLCYTDTLKFHLPKRTYIQSSACYVCLKLTMFTILWSGDFPLLPRSIGGHH